MDRRAFVGALALEALATLDHARAQPARKVYRIGVLGTSSTTSELAGPEPQSPATRVLLRGLRELGYVYGEHFVTEARGSEGKIERFPDLAAELVRLNVDVIIGPGPALPALKQATSTIPVVMVGAANPEGQGLVQSLARPGGNFTGLSLQLTETIGKRLELLKELVPGPTPVAVLWDRLGASGGTPWEAAQSAARQRGWKLVSVDIREFTGKIEGAFKAATDARAGALFVHPSALLDQNARRIAELAASSRLPASRWPSPSSPVWPGRSFRHGSGLPQWGSDDPPLTRSFSVSEPRWAAAELATGLHALVRGGQVNALRIRAPEDVDGGQGRRLRGGDHRQRKARAQDHRRGCARAVTRPRPREPWRS